MRERETRTKADKKRSRLSCRFLYSAFHLFRFHISEAWNACLPQIHIRSIIIFPPRLLFHRCGWQLSRIFFSSLSSFLRSSLSHLRCFFLCLLGNLAVVMRRSVLVLDKRKGYRWRRRVRRIGGEGDPDGCERIRSRNVTWMQYLKAAQRQYSLLSTGALSRRLLCSIAKPSFEDEKREPPVTLIRH